MEKEIKKICLHREFGETVPCVPVCPTPGPVRETFYARLITQNKRNDPVGDLARDVLADSLFPVSASVDQIRNYLEDQGACAGAMEAFERAVFAFP